MLQLGGLLPRQHQVPIWQLGRLEQVFLLKKTTKSKRIEQELSQQPFD